MKTLGCNLDTVPLAENLKKLRKEKNLLQKDIAAVLHISERQYRTYEADNTDLSISKIIALADFFNVSIDFLVGRSQKRTLE
jgi:transcriptional regulator with XRE-family HTH domain